MLELIQLVDMVEAAVGSEALGTVRRQLRELDARSAMDALNLLHVITKNCNEEDPNLGELKAAERFLRDVVVMFLVNRVGAAPDRAIFLDTAEDINGTHLDRELKAKSCWLTINSSITAEAFGLEMEPPTGRDWVNRVADGVAQGNQEMGEPHAATWTGKAWAARLP